MTPRPPGDDPQDAPALAALSELARDAVQPHTAGELDQGLDAVVGRLAAVRVRRRALRRWAMVGATAAACGAAALIVKVRSGAREGVPGREPSVVVSRIEGGTLLEGGYLSQSGAAGVKVVFNEGTTFQLMPGTRGKLRAVERDGAHFAVEHGTASFGVTPSRDHQWLVEAGPFLVTVKGTVFTVSWDSSAERFELGLRQGHVLVTGPVVNGGIALRAGQHLVVSLPRAETVITEDKPAGGSGAAAPEPAAPPRNPPVPATSVASSTVAAPPSGAGPGARPRRWAAALASGRWDRILADVDRAGVDATLESAGSDELFVLADAARYRRRPDLARAALLAHRRRFPHGPRALDAVFLLGRVEELREHGSAGDARAQAIVWYDEYLARAPAGPYAAEALGRKMILTNELGGPARARPIAREYLVRFPSGSYAGAARALERVP